MRRKNRRSGMVNRTQAAPRIQNEARQFKCSPMKPVNEPPTATPINWLVPKIAIARERDCGPCARH